VKGAIQNTVIQVCTFKCKQNHLIQMFASRYFLLLNLVVKHGVNYNMGTNIVTTLGKRHIIMTWVSNPNYGVVNL
jgi:hypothetical protein